MDLEALDASDRFDPFDADYLTDPYQTLAYLREQAPVFFSEVMNGWVVTRHATVRSIMRDTVRFSNKNAFEPHRPLCPMAREAAQRYGFSPMPLLVNNDPPAHTRLRKFLGAPLSPARLKAMEPVVRAIVDAQLDRMVAGPNPTDIAEALTWDVPAMVLFRLIGIPDSDLQSAKAWADSRTVLNAGVPSDEDQVRLVTSAAEYFQYARKLVAGKLEQPGDDYTSDLLALRAHDDGKATLDEIASQVFNLLFAGHETTSSAAANMFLNLLRQESAWAQVRNGDKAVAAVVEESLRMDPPAQVRKRLTTQPVELDGVAIPAGARLFLFIGAANRDPETFQDPEQFCPARPDGNKHLTFGFGAHMCLGAPLARLELSVMLELACKRLPNLRLAPDARAFYVPNTSFRGARNVVVSW